MRTHKGYQQITALAAVATLTIPTGATAAIVQAEGQNVRYRTDGTDPTATVGMILVANEPVLLEGPLDAYEFIETAASAKLNVQYLA